MRLREFIVERITVIKFGVNDRGSNGTGSLIKVRPDTAKLTNVIVTGFVFYCLCTYGTIYIINNNK